MGKSRASAGGNTGAMWRLYPRIMAVTVTPETLRRLIREAEAARARAAAPTLNRAFAQLAAGYRLQLQRMTGCREPAVADDPPPQQWFAT
jgi:hypothetical protein